MAKNDYCNWVCTCFAIFSIVGIIIAFVIPLIEIIIGSIYFNNTTCESFLDIGLWFIIKGIITIILLSSVFIYSYYHEKIINKLSIYYIISLINIVNLSWLIIGSIIFFRDCPHLQPYEIKTFILISLIISYIGFFSVTKYSSN